MCFCTIFFFNDTATTEIYTLSLHDALPILHSDETPFVGALRIDDVNPDYHTWLRQELISPTAQKRKPRRRRSEEHTSELQSRQYLVCRLLLEKKKKPVILVQRLIHHILSCP